MATVYVSYRSTEEPFVGAVVTGSNSGTSSASITTCRPVWTGGRISSRTCERATSPGIRIQGDPSVRLSERGDGGARFCQTYVDGKTLIPALIDAVDPRARWPTWTIWI